jgi:hypothetical protein
MTTTASHQTTTEASEIAQAHKDQPESNEVQTPQMSAYDQAFQVYLQVAEAIAGAQGKAAGQKKNQLIAVRQEAFNQMREMWDMAFKAGQNHGLELAFSSIAAEAPINPFTTVSAHL